MTIGFSDLNYVWLHESILPQTYSWLVKAGQNSDEAFVLWAGEFCSPTEFAVVSAIYPEQIPFRTKNGVGVHVSGDELFRIGKWLHEHNQVLVAQVHSHPVQAYHSDTDDTFPLVTAVGQFSVVVPNFARGAINLSTWAAYRLTMDGQWAALSSSQISSIFKVVKT